jgi:hypothetical protein
MEFGFIYKVTCKNTGKTYVGQAKELKTKNDKPYNYGIKGRWCDHVSSSKNHSTPIAIAIQEHGAEAFELCELAKAQLHELDALEAEWIKKLNSLVPNGYNVASHSRNKHHKTTTFHTQFAGNVNKAIISPINKEAEASMIYVHLELKDNTTKRITFGQDTNKSFDDAYSDALEFVEKLDCKVIDCCADRFALQKDSIDSLSGKIIDVTITTASNLIAIYFMTNTMKKRDERLRICFGGKYISHEIAYKTALQFIQELNLSNNIINDKILNQCRQQAAASMVGDTP